MSKDIDYDFLAKIRARVPDFNEEANTGLPKGSLKCGNGLLTTELGHIWDLELKLFLSTGLKIFNEADEFGDFFSRSHWPIMCLGDNRSNPNIFPKNKSLLVEGFVWPMALAFCRADSMSNTRLLFYRARVDGREKGGAPDPILYYQGELGANLAADFLAAYYNRVLTFVLMKPNRAHSKKEVGLMEIFIFDGKIESSLRQAIMSAGGKKVSLEMIQKTFSGSEKNSLVIKAYALSDREKFPYKSKLKNILYRRVKDLDLSTRTINILSLHFSNLNHVLVHNVVSLEENDLLRVVGCGRKRQLEVRNILRSLGLDFMGCLSEKERQLVQLAL